MITEKEIANRLDLANRNAFAFNGGRTITIASPITEKYFGLRAYEDSEITFESTATQGDKTITLGLKEGEYFMFPMKNIQVNSGSILAFIA